MITVGSLFSGIGLLDLGLERAGLRIIWHSEKDKQASKVLANRWPSVPNLGDVTRIDWSTVERPDVLSLGGWPCQPLSSAGKQLGRDDHRYLWPECARALRSLRPQMCVMEQSPNVLTLFGGDIFCEVLGDLAQAGFDAKWAVIPASDLGAPHKRARLFLAAYADGWEPQRWRGPGVLGSQETTESKPLKSCSTDGGESLVSAQPGASCGVGIGGASTGVRDLGRSPGMARETAANPNGDGCSLIEELHGQSKRPELNSPLRGNVAGCPDVAPHTENDRWTGGGASRRWRT